MAFAFLDVGAVLDGTRLLLDELPVGLELALEALLFSVVVMVILDTDFLIPI